MSGIYGVISKREIFDKDYKGLSIWNANYGDSAEECKQGKDFLIGIKPEHLRRQDLKCNGLTNFDNVVAVSDCLIFAGKNEAVSDSDYLIETVTNKGLNGLREINGDFAGALYDIGKRKLILYRDHMGIRPLFYYEDENRVIFSTDIRGILSVKDVDVSRFKEKIITDYELLLNYTPGIKIGITGTKGKSTTSTLMYNVLKEQGKKCFLLGNIGNPILDYLDEITEDSYCVVEVSSHTLEFVKSSPNIGILLNVFPEHLDHVNSLNDYIKAKFNIAVDKKTNFIYNAENELMVNYNYKYNPEDIAVFLNDRENKNVKNKVYLKDNGIYFNNKFLMNADEPRKIKGNHMLNNMMFILAASQILGLDLKKTIQTLKNTEPLEHRMEYVGKFNNIYFYNDAIATIPVATINCIKTIGNVNTLICGGMDRGVPQDELIDFLKQSDVENIICMPDTGNEIYNNLNKIKKCYLVDSMEDAVKIANDVTKRENACVLSPAASSYNRFKSFDEKGKLYKKCVGNIINK